MVALIPLVVSMQLNRCSITGAHSHSNQWRSWSRTCLITLLGSKLLTIPRLETLNIKKLNLLTITRWFVALFIYYFQRKQHGELYSRRFTSVRNAGSEQIIGQHIEMVWRWTRILSSWIRRLSYSDQAV